MIDLGGITRRWHVYQKQSSGRVRQVIGDLIRDIKRQITKDQYSKHITTHWTDPKDQKATSRAHRRAAARGICGMRLIQHTVWL